MGTKERTGNAPIPKWWLDRAIPKLNGTDMTQAEIARLASAYAKRSSPWDASAINKFKTGQGRTYALTNGISAALGIVQPFYVAPSEGTANIIAEIVRQEQQRADEESAKLAVVDTVAAAEIHSAAIDAKTARGVRSPDYAETRGVGVRSRRHSSETLVG